MQGTTRCKKASKPSKQTYLPEAAVSGAGRQARACSYGGGGSGEKIDERHLQQQHSHTRINTCDCNKIIHQLIKTATWLVFGWRARASWDDSYPRVDRRTMCSKLKYHGERAHGTDFFVRARASDLRLTLTASPAQLWSLAAADAAAAKLSARARLTGRSLVGEILPSSSLRPHRHELTCPTCPGPFFTSPCP